MQNPYSKVFLDMKFLFVNRFSKFLLHILGLKECLIMIREYLYEGVLQRGDTRKTSFWKTTRIITETSPYLFGNFRKLSLYNCFMPI